MILDIPEIVRNHVIKNCNRMPETEDEVNQYLDLINHLKEYEKSVALKELIGEKYMRKWGIRLPAEIEREGLQIFNNLK